MNSESKYLCTDESKMNKVDLLGSQINTGIFPNKGLYTITSLFARIHRNTIFDAVLPLTVTNIML